MKLEATFVRSAAVAEDFVRDGLAEIALVGRSNVGKSSLINALVRQRLARTSAAPGKTRLVNFYRIARGAAAPFYVADLPGYGYARGGHRAAEEFGALTRAFGARYWLTGTDRELEGALREALAEGGPAVVEVRPGDVFHVESGGGGGWGDPSRRPRETIVDWLTKRHSPRQVFATQLTSQPVEGLPALKRVLTHAGLLRREDDL